MGDYKKWQKISVYENNGKSAEQEKDAYNDEYHALTAEGYVKVHVYTARRAYPICNAKVEISKTINNKNYLRSFNTDISGSTEIITLPAPPKYLSLEPGYAHPYATYKIKVSHPDFSTVEHNDLRVFEGIVSLQNIDLVPMKLTMPEKKNNGGA